MKTKLGLIGFLLVVGCLRGAAGGTMSTSAPVPAAHRFALTFTGSGDAAHEYVVERLVSNPAGSAEEWITVATAPASPFEFTDQAQPGTTYTIRVRARLREAPAQVSAPSTSASVFIPSLLVPPTGINLRLLLQVLVSP